MSDYLTTADLARLYGVTAETINSWAREGKIPTALVTPGGHRRFRVGDVLAVLPVEGVTAESVMASLAAERQAS